MQSEVVEERQKAADRGGSPNTGRTRASVAPRSRDGSPRTPYSMWSDLELVESLSDETGDAYCEIYRRHCGAVTAAARMILMRDQRCEDVVAEVFVSLWFFPEKFDASRGTLLAYLRLKARGRAIDIVRAESARVRREAAERPTAPDLDADVILVSAESALAVREALALLPATEREPITLAFFTGLTYLEVAARLGVPEGTVKGRIRSGLNRLKADHGLRTLRAGDDGTSVGAER